MGVLTKEQILTKDDLITETIHVPEWDDDVKIRALSLLEWEKLTKMLDQVPDGQEMRTHALWAAAYLVNGHGERIFDIEQLDDVWQLLNKSPGALRRISRRAMLLSRQVVEAFKENFPETQGESSPSS